MKQNVTRHKGQVVNISTAFAFDCQGNCELQLELSFQPSALSVVSFKLYGIRYLMTLRFHHTKISFFLSITVLTLYCFIMQGYGIQAFTCSSRSSCDFTHASAACIPVSCKLSMLYFTSLFSIFSIIRCFRYHY